MTLDQRVPLGVGLEMVRGLNAGKARGLAERLADAAGEVRMGVDAAAHRRAADRQFQHRRQRHPRPAKRTLQLPRQAAELLAERQRRGVDQVRATDLQHVLPRRRLLAQRPRALPQRRQQLLLDRQGDGEVDRRGKDVVGALPHVDVIVGMDRLGRGEAIAAGQFDRPIRNHLVDVHVRRGAGAGLKDIDRELIVKAAVGDFPGGGNQGLDLGGGEWVFTRIPQLS